MLQTAYELEGLLRLLREREDDPELVLLVQAKAYALADMAAALTVKAPEVEAYAESEPGPEAEPEVVFELGAGSPPAQPEPEVEVGAVPEVSRPQGDVAQMAPVPAGEGAEFMDDDEEPEEARPEGGIEDEELEDFEPEEPRRERPLKSFFSINDRFRFKRTLFGESEEDFNGTLRVLESLPTLDEAEDYLYADMEYNPDNLDVQSFVSILERYYGQA